MGLFSKPIGQVFYKESTDLKDYILKLEELLPRASGETKSKIEKQIAIARYGELGEKNIEYELKNSGIDMYVLRDLYFEVNDLSAQIDYLIITKHRNYIIESKNLIGNIEIDNTGNFVRTFEINGKKIKEGIYSPVTQNQRHLNVIKEMMMSNQKSFIGRSLIEMSFDKDYKSLVVLANPKTILYAKFAKKEVKNKVIRADQLVEKLKELEKVKTDYTYNEKEIITMAQYLLSQHKENHSSYDDKYNQLLQEVNSIVSETIHEEPTRQKDLDGLRKALKSYRYNQSKAENIKPYFIFNDVQMEDLILKYPRTPEELINVSGFGEKKVEKYGTEIIHILNNWDKD